MAAVTENSRQRTLVAGHVKIETYDVDIAANNDTLTVSGMTAVFGAWASPDNSTESIGATIATNVVTFKTAGAESNVKVLVVGN